MYCPQCGNEIEETAKFCPYCGSQIKKADLSSEKNERIIKLSETSTTTGWKDSKHIVTNTNEKRKDSRKKHNKWLIPIIVVIAAALSLSLVLYFFESPTRNVNPESSSERSSPKTSETAGENRPPRVLFSGNSDTFVRFQFGESDDDIFFTVSLPSDVEVMTARYLNTVTKEVKDFMFSSDNPNSAEIFLKENPNSVFGDLSLRATASGNEENNSYLTSTIHYVITDHVPASLYDSYPEAEYVIVDNKAIAFEQDNSVGEQNFITIRLYIPLFKIDNEDALLEVICSLDGLSSGEKVNLGNYATELYQTVSLRTDGIAGYIEDINEEISSDSSSAE